MERRRFTQEPKKGWSWGWIGWSLISAIFLSLAYALSMGPAELWANNGGQPSDTRWQTVSEIYAPLNWITSHCEWAAQAENWYLVKVCKSHY
jgi:hypothetical protein